MQQLRETKQLAWSEIEHGVTWASVGTAGKEKIRLMAEQMPDGSWRWTTWRSSRPDELQSGSVSTLGAACVAAEDAAATMAHHDRGSSRR
jgi:hypothetical protein